MIWQIMQPEQPDPGCHTADPAGRRPLLTHRPVLHTEFGHGEVSRIAGGQKGIDANSGGRDQAIGLMECHPFFGMVAPPCPGQCAFILAERGEAKTAHQASSIRTLSVAESPPDLLDGDHTDPGLVSNASHRAHAFRSRPASECIDEDGRVEQDTRHGSARALRIGAALFSHPARGIDVPRMTAVLDAAQGSFDIVPALLVIESTFDQLGDEGAAASFASTPIEFGEEFVVDTYV